MKLVKFPVIFLIAALLIPLLVLTGCSDKEQSETNKPDSNNTAAATAVRGGIYRTALFNTPTTLDPAQVQNQYGLAIVQQMFDGLVKFGPYLMVAPALAKTWTVAEGGTVYRFELRKDARFHNGEPVTAEDAVFSLSRLLRMSPPPAPLPHLLKIDGAQAYRDHLSEHVSGLKAIKDRLLEIRLKAPHGPLLTALGTHQAKIVSKAEVNRLGDAFGTSPVGSGPFRFVSIQADRVVKLARFSDYYDGPGHLHYNIYPSEAYDDTVADFRRGLLEDLPVFGGQVKKELADLKTLQWFNRPSLSLFFYGLNCKDPLLKHPQVRKALSMVIDRQHLVDTVYDGQFAVAKGILPPGMPGFYPKDRVGPVDTTAAKELITNAVGDNLENLAPIEIVSAYESPRVTSELALITEFWAQLGLKTTLKYITDWAQFEAYIASGDVQVYRYAWFADMPDPDSFLYPLFAATSSVNFMKFQDNRVDQQLLAAREISDPGQRAEKYRQIEDDIMTLSPLIPLFNLSVDRVYQPYVRNAQPSALGEHTMPLHQVWLNK